jgi:hypothetical protein
MSPARKSSANSPSAADQEAFTFEISLSVLNHLGRSLYRSFATVLGEAISNAWDADAKNVEIIVDKKKNSFLIIDDGIGMTAADFQNKFLRIGYSKRKAGRKSSDGGRPFVGRKGIGKLALLSCADKITVLSKVSGGKWIGGVIDNSELDDAITEDLKPQQYPLGKWKAVAFKKHTKARKHGTIIYFDGLKKGIKASFPLLEKIIALYFRFSLLDPTFRISLNGKPITHKHLKELAAKTEFLWKIGEPEDPFLDDLDSIFENSPDDHAVREIEVTGVAGFVASVEKPRDLKIFGTEERVGVDLFVNGRLRERDILKHIPTAQIAESYLYGQIHFDGLDDKTDRFTSSREGIVADDPKYAKFLETFRKEVLKIVNEWDEMRTSRRKEGDPENPRLSPKQRASRGLFGAVSDEYALPKGSKRKDKVAGWVDGLSEDAAFNFESYADCFVSENLIRQYITTENVALSPEAKQAAQQWRDKEKSNKGKGNISIAIRRDPSDSSYLSMDDLAYLVDKRDPQKEACLARDANEYKPIRDAMAHTALLTTSAKTKLSTVRENIKERVKTILADKP